MVTLTGSVSGSTPTVSGSTTIVFEFVDPCDPPVSITSAQWLDQRLMLTDVGSYSHPEVIVEPQFCPFEAEYTISNLPNGESAITQDSVDESSFSFSYSTGLYPLDKSQTVSLVYTSTSTYGASNPSVTATFSFNLNFDNPCTDSDYVSIQCVSLPDLDYIINSGRQTYDAHGLPLIVTKPIVHDFCGELSIRPTLEGAPINAADLLSYDSVSRRFSIESDDLALINQFKTYGFTA